MSDTELTDRELRIARHAADAAVKQITEGFYKEVGKTVVNKFLILVGAMAVAFCLGKYGLPGNFFK